MTKLTRYVLIAIGAGAEQFLYTLYLLSVSRYMIMVSSILQFIYMSMYLLLISFAIKDSKNTLGLMLTYALATSLSNWLAMSLHIIK